MSSIFFFYLESICSLDITGCLNVFCYSFWFLASSESFLFCACVSAFVRMFTILWLTSFNSLFFCLCISYFYVILISYKVDPLLHAIRSAQLSRPFKRSYFSFSLCSLIKENLPKEVIFSISS